MNDSGGLVAAAISSRALSPRRALALAAGAEFVGPFLFGSAIAATIGKNLVQFSALTSEVLLVAIASAIVWNIITAFFGLPSSSTHALLGGLIGAVAIPSGAQALMAEGFIKVLIGLFGAPVLGMAVGYLILKTLLLLTRNASPRVNRVFIRSQVLNVITLSLSHGTNDGQKSIGLIALALGVAQGQPHQTIPTWVTLLVALAMMFGVSLGGWRIIRTMGSKIYRLRPIHATAVQTASACIVLGAALLGAPVSTSQVVSGAIMGAGSAERVSGVRWTVAGQIVGAWLVTIPLSACLAALIQKALAV